MPISPELLKDGEQTRATHVVSYDPSYGADNSPLARITVLAYPAASGVLCEGCESGKDVLVWDTSDSGGYVLAECRECLDQAKNFPDGSDFAIWPVIACEIPGLGKAE